MSVTRIAATRVVSVVAALAVILALPGTAAQAAPEVAPAASSHARSGFAAAVAKLDPYVVRKADGTFTINAPHRVIDRIPARDYQAVLASSDATNRDIRAGLLESTADGTVQLADEPTQLAAADVTSAPSNSIVWNWWGALIHLDAATAANLISALGAAAGVSGLLTILVNAGVISSAAAVPLAIITAVLTAATAGLTACLTENGLDLYVTYVVLTWCQQPTA